MTTRHILFAIGGSMLAGSAVSVPVPALAQPTDCQYEIMVRCSGHSYYGRPRLDLIYNSYQECYDNEYPVRCDFEQPVNFNADPASSLPYKHEISNS